MFDFQENLAGKIAWGSKSIWMKENISKHGMQDMKNISELDG